LTIDNNEWKNNHESSIEDDEEVIDESDAECNDPDEETIIQTIQIHSRKKSFCPFKDGKIE